MKKEVFWILIAIVIASSVLYVRTVWAAKSIDTGSDEFGYNYANRTFNGVADGADRVWDGLYYKDPTYAKDHLTMKWTVEWENFRKGLPGDPNASLDMTWNGMLKGGSKSSEHAKTIWVGPLGENSPYWVPGGYGYGADDPEIETIKDRGIVDGVHTWWVGLYLPATN